MTRLLALFEDPEGPSARLRFDLHRAGLEVAGVEVTQRGIPRGLLARRRLWKEAASHDVVYVQRRLVPAWQVRALRRRSRRLVFDLDDALGLRDRAPFESTTRRRRLGAWLDAADVILIGCEELREHVDAARGRCILLPTTVPLPTELSPGDPRRAMWVGQAGTARYLAPLLPVFEQLAHDLPGWSCRVLGAPPGFASGRAGVVEVPWSPEAEQREWAAAGVWVAPLAEDPWTLGKCGTRMHRALSHGCAVVAAPVGVQVRIAGQCAGVRLAKSAREWRGALRDLALGSPEAPAAVQDRWARHYAPSVWTSALLRAVRGEDGSCDGGVAEG